VLRQYKLRKISSVLLHGPGSARKQHIGTAPGSAPKKSMMISCRFCGTSNARKENRCFRCGRRLHLANARPAPESYRSTLRDADPPEAPPPDIPHAPTVEGGGWGTATKMAREPVSVPAPSTSEPPIIIAAPRTPEPPHPSTLRSAGGLPGEGEWGSLSFQQARDRERAPESDIYTDENVAPLMARVMAGVYDALVMLAAFAVMAVAYALMTRNLDASPVPESALGWSIYGALMLAVVAFYRSLFILVGADSPGMQWAGLRLVTFDGDAPTAHHRWMRVAWGAFSVLPLGLGLLWALVDQERLTWHDLLSKTFPSPDTTARSLPRWSR
jgi:uncharacterized RDD family membrane protein YckC